MAALPRASDACIRYCPLNSKGLTATVWPSKTDDFCALSLDSKGYGKSDAAAKRLRWAGAFLTQVVPHNNIELVRAMKSALIRQLQLAHEVSRDRTRASVPTAVFSSRGHGDVDHGTRILGERRVVLNVQERTTYAHLLGD